MRGVILKDRYQVQGFIDEGQYGKVYTVRDLQAAANHQPLVVKFSQDKEAIALEIRHMKKVYESYDMSTSIKKSTSSISPIPKVIEYGYIALHNMKTQKNRKK